MSQDITPSVRRCAALYIAHNHRVVGLHPKTKRPRGANWQNRTWKPEDFGDADNIGWLLDKKVDADLDDRLAIAAAPWILPATPARFGHHGDITHYMYYVSGPPEAHHSWGVCEYRTGAHQTMVPGSIWHATKPGDERAPERVKWAAANGHAEYCPTLATVPSRELYESLETLSGLTIMGHEARPGMYHHVSVNMAGYCYHRKVPEEQAIKAILAILHEQGSDCDAQKTKNVTQTYLAGDEGKPVSAYSAITTPTAERIRLIAPSLLKVSTPASTFEDLSTPAPDDFVPAPVTNPWGDIHVDSTEYVGPAPPRVWTWDNWIPRGVVTGLAGPPGVAKSTLALQLCLHQCIGLPYLGCDMATGPALFITVEDDAHELWRRVERLRNALFLEPEDVPGLGLLAAGESATALVDVDAHGTIVATKYLRYLEEHIESTGATLVVLDLVGDFWNGSENARNEVSTYVRQHLGRLASRLQISLLVISHLNKAGGVSGSTAWEGSYRSVITMMRSAGNAEHIALRTSKANYAPPMEEPILVKWERGYIMAVSVDERTEQARTEDERLLDQLAAGMWYGVMQLRGLWDCKQNEVHAIARRLDLETRRHGNAINYRRPEDAG